MELYRGSVEVVCNPRIIQPERTLDYGSGFYTTTSFHQAEQWARRRMQLMKLNAGYVNVYALDEEKAGEMMTLRFDSPSEAWLDFVMSNRMNPDFNHDYDLIYGLVANDRVYAAFALYESGLLDKDGLLKELKVYKLVDQMLFHTERSLECLSFVDARIIK